MKGFREQVTTFAISKKSLFSGFRHEGKSDAHTQRSSLHSQRHERTGERVSRSIPDSLANASHDIFADSLYLSTDRQHRRTAISYLYSPNQSVTLQRQQVYLLQRSTLPNIFFVLFQIAFRYFRHFSEQELCFIQMTSKTIKLF